MCDDRLVQLEDSMNRVIWFTAITAIFGIIATFALIVALT